MGANDRHRRPDARRDRSGRHQWLLLRVLSSRTRPRAVLRHLTWAAQCSGCSRSGMRT